MSEQIWKYAVSLCQNIPLMVYGVMACLFFLGVVLFIAFYGLKRGWRKIACLVLAEYVFLIYCSTLIFRTYSEIRGYDFSPFWSYVAILDGKTQYLPENIMNVIVFVPVGILLGCSFRMTWWKALFFGCGISVSIEAIQYMFKRGFAETDDLIHNTIGCLFGYLLVKSASLMFYEFKNLDEGKAIS